MKKPPQASAFRAKLRACVAEELDAHWRQLEGGACRNLRALVLNAAEEELVEFAMRRANRNQNAAAKILGVSRATLIRKLNGKAHSAASVSAPLSVARKAAKGAKGAREAREVRGAKGEGGVKGGKAGAPGKGGATLRGGHRGRKGK